MKALLQSLGRHWPAGAVATAAAALLVVRPEWPMLVRVGLAVLIYGCCHDLATTVGRLSDEATRWGSKAAKKAKALKAAEARSAELADELDAVHAELRFERGLHAAAEDEREADAMAEESRVAYSDASPPMETAGESPAEPEPPPFVEPEKPSLEYSQGRGVRVPDVYQPQPELPPLRMTEIRKDEK